MQNEPKPVPEEKKGPKPAGAGRRPARVSLGTFIAGIVISGILGGFLTHVFFPAVQSTDSNPGDPPVTVSAPEPTVPVPAIGDPKPDHHPLAGRKRILSASPGNWRNALLSFSRISPDIEFPFATADMDSRREWELVGDEGNKDVYRILSRTPGSVGDPEDAALSLTSVDGEEFPYVSLFAEDSEKEPALWKITTLKDFPDRYLIECFDNQNWHGKWLTLESDHAFSGETPFPAAALGPSKTFAWKILHKGDPLPSAPRPVTHVIIFPRQDIGEEAKERLKDWAADIETHIMEDPGAVRLHLTLSDGNTLESTYGGLDFAEAASQMSASSDPVAEFLPGSARLPDLAGESVAEQTGDDRKLSPFPLVLPVIEAGNIRVESIRTLLLEDTAFWINKLEKVEGFQSRLDDGPGEPDSDGRVFHGEDYFSYVFVNLEKDTGRADE